MHFKKINVFNPLHTYPTWCLVPKLAVCHLLNLQDWQNRFMGKKCFLINHECNLHLVKCLCTRGPTDVFSHEPEQKFHTKQNIIFIFIWKTSNFSSSSCKVQSLFFFLQLSGLDFINICVWYVLYITKLGIDWMKHLEYFLNLLNLWNSHHDLS